MTELQTSNTENKSRIHLEMGTAILTGIWLLSLSAFRVHSYQGQTQSSSFSTAFWTDFA